MTVFSENFYIIGHRGAAAERFENSLEGFKHALTLDIDAIELDIREHSAELWVIHDDDLERLTGNAGLFADHASPSTIRLRNGEALPTLRQVLDLYWGKMPVNIEIKSITNLNLLLDLLAEYPAPKPVAGLPWILISFRACSMAWVASRSATSGCPFPIHRPADNAAASVALTRSNPRLWCGYSGIAISQSRLSVS